MTEFAASATVPRRRLWRRGVCWLLLLAPFFFLSYGQVNLYTASRSDVSSLVFAWETHIPFLPWTIVPYWSIDLLYGISLFICTSYVEQTRHAWRLLAASLCACAGFLLFPLKFSFTRPHTEGLFGWLFQQLELFDLPYNQAPSLHIMLTWLLWLRFWPHLRGYWRAMMSIWMVLITFSVLTTWQHHFIDVVTGLAAGIVVSYAIPIDSQWRWRSSDSSRLARRYSYGAAICAALAVTTSYWLLWPALALAIVALGYAGLGVSVLQKNSVGRISPSAKLLLWCYFAGANLSMRWFARRLPAVTVIEPDILLGRYPLQLIAAEAVLDLTGEFPRSHYTNDKVYLCCPMLDLALPSMEQLSHAVATLEQLRRQHGRVLVHCALGLSRSALVVAAWLLMQGKVTTPQQAADWLRRYRPQIVLHETHLRMLEQWITTHKISH